MLTISNDFHPKSISNEHANIAISSGTISSVTIQDNKPNSNQNWSDSQITSLTLTTRKRLIISLAVTSGR